MGKSNTELLKIAQSHLGQGGARFRKFCGLPAGAAWCNAFVDYVANEGGDASLFFDGKRPTYCPQSIKWCRQYLAQIPIYIALPMDIIYFDWEPNNVPNHIGFVRERKSDQEVYTIEGNTSGGIVAQKTRVEKYVCGVFRPHFKPSGYDANKKLAVDGYFGYNSIAVMQRWLGVTQDAILGQGTVKALQKRLGVAQDGSWGPNTSKALQKLIGTTVDGAFGPKSVKAFQAYLNDHAFKSTPTDTPSVSKPAATKPVTATNASKIASMAKSLSWPYGTPEAQWKYSTGAPTEAYKLKTPKVSKITRSDCGYFVKVVTRNTPVGGFNPLNDKNVPKTLKIVHSGKAIPNGLLQPGDIIAYKKTEGQHTLIYMGNGMIAEAGRKIRFPVIRKSTKYNGSDVRKSTIKVYRAR